MSTEGTSSYPSSSGSDDSKTRKVRGYNQINYNKIEKVKSNITPHTTSRRRMTRLRRAKKLATGIDSDEVDRADIWVAGHTHKDETVVSEDAADKIVFGDEHRGRVQGLSASATPSQVHASVVSENSDLELELQVKELTQQMSALRGYFMRKSAKEDLDPELCAIFNIPPKQPMQYSSDSNPMGGKAHNLGESSQQPLSQACTSIGEESNRNGMSYQLINWRSGQVVAETEIDCKDPQDTVHHKVLGPDC